MMLRPLVEACLGGLCAFSLGYWIISALLVRRRMTLLDVANSREALEPVSFLRPLKADVPDLPARLQEAFLLMRPSDQLVIGVDANSPEAKVCDAIRSGRTDLAIVIVPCRPGLERNPKINKLAQMSAAITNERVILMDSEAMPDAAWMQQFREEWETSGCAVFTAGYRFVGADSWWQRLDAAPVLLTLWPGLATVEFFGRLRFALGACIALHRRDLAELGGWEQWGDDLAEDHALGQSFAKAGFRIGLSRQVLPLQSDPMNFGAYWRHQRRAAVTYRVANPAGFAGQIISHGVTFAVLLLMVSGGAAWAWLVGGVVALGRVICVQLVSGAVGWLFSRLWIVTLLASLLETVFWVAAWLRPQVWWAGRWWRVLSNGRMEESGAATPAPTRGAER